MYKSYLKRTIDLITSLIVLVLLFPILIIVTLLLAIANHGKPFFFQIRPGKNEKLFKIIKFKTMTDGKDKKGNLLPDALRITQFGDFLRKTSLDELPQLINVLMGDMSLIGPRPLLVEYLPLYSPEQRKRHQVKPGITGWAKINGRNAISWEQKFEHDIWYINNIRFMTDLIIFLKTFVKVFKNEGINRKGESTTTRFKGNG